jgi:hypothetical protein
MMIHRTKAFTTGLILAALLALSDLLTVPFGDGEHPPMAVAVGGAVLGLITLAWFVPAWRGGRTGIWVVIATRALSALSAAPAFVVSDVPAGAVIAAGAIIVITTATVFLLVPALSLTPARSPS